MPYRIKMSSVAEKDFEKFDRLKKLHIGEKLLALAKDPYGLSRDSVCPPHPPGYRIHEFHTLDEEFYWAFSILFNVDEAGALLSVAGIGHVQFDRDIEWDPPEE